ncbi:MAG: DegT/DnrJ/EryC1/StrS family aminotransferase, partial [Burkholderiales bacterium]|nr:DegT/DnrJ/EryC1/StrS family aminotransferase [Burkholderiales bacterium]
MNPSEQEQRNKSGPRLAVFGGTPAFAEARHVGRPNLGDRDRFMARLNDILDKRWLTNRGEYVIELEKRIAELVGVRNCILVCNGTVGLELLHGHFSQLFTLQYRHFCGGCSVAALSAAALYTVLPPV